MTRPVHPPLPPFRDLDEAHEAAPELRVLVVAKIGWLELQERAPLEIVPRAMAPEPAR